MADGRSSSESIREAFRKLERQMDWASSNTRDEPPGFQRGQAWLDQLRQLLFHEECDPIALARMVYLLQRFASMSAKTKDLTRQVLRKKKWWSVWFTKCSDPVMMTQWAPRQLSNVLYAMSRLEAHPQSKFLQMWYSSAMDQMTSFPEQELVVALYALAKLGVRPPPEFLRTWIQRAEVMVEDFSTQALALTMYSLGKVQSDPCGGFMKSWTASSIRKLQRFQARELSCSMHGFRLLGIQPDGDFMDAWLRISSASFAEFSGRDLVDSLYSLGSLGIPLRANYVESWCAHAIQTMASFVCTDFACSMKSFALLKMRPSSSFITHWYAGAQIVLLRDRVTSQELAMMLHSVAELQIAHNQTFLLYWCNSAVKHMREFRPPELTTTIHAFAVMSLEPLPALWQAWTRQARALLNDFNRIELSTVAYAVGRLGLSDVEEFMDQWTHHTLPLLNTWDPRQLVNGMYGLSKLDYTPDPSWVESWHRAAIGVIDKLTPQGIANLVYALANSHDEAIDLEIWWRVVAEKLDRFSGIELSCLLRSCLMSRKTSGPAHLIERICDAVERKVEGMQPRTMSTIIFTLAKLGYTPKPSFRSSWEAECLSSLNEMDDLSFAQTLWAYAAWQVPLGDELHLHFYRRLDERVWRMDIVCILTLIRSLIMYRNSRIPEKLELDILDAAKELFRCMGSHRSRWRLRGVLTDYFKARNLP